jgi:IBR (half RING finger) domain-containing protein
MDDASAALIIDLQQEDVADALENQKGKQVAGRQTDFELALDTYKNDLDCYGTILRDHRIARSMGMAVQDDAVALTIALQEEARNADDRAIALRLGGHEGSSADQHQTGRLRTNVSEETLARFGQLSVNEEPLLYTGTTFDETEAGSSKGAAGPRRGYLDCAACMDSKPISDMVKVPCSHHYCRPCAVRLFEESITDESLFPPRCCRQVIPLSVVRGFLGFKLVNQFEAISVERNDPYRTYCANPACSAYIFPDMVKLYVGTCTSCLDSTCTLCKKLAHEGYCRDDEREQVLEMARTEGWRQCFKCRNMIELGVGCNHITSVLTLPFLFLLSIWHCHVESL